MERAEVRGPLAMRLGVSADALDALGVGLLGSASTWPMRDYLGRAIGVRLRSLNTGAKYAVKGSKNGLFLPSVDEQVLVLVCEGASDTAAALSLGFFAIGRPDCKGGRDLIRRWIERRSNRDAVLVADNDEPGQSGAHELAEAIAPLVRSVCIIRAPLDSKDLREAVQRGATRADVLALIEAAPRIVAEVRRREP